MSLPKLKKKLWILMRDWMRGKIPYCQYCGETQKILHVHHIVPKARGNGAYFNVENLLVLCSGCHLGWHVRWTTEEQRTRAIALIGQEQYDRIQNPQDYTRKMSQGDYEDLIDYYKKKLEAL